MCYQVDCKQCGNVTWGGCGRHVASVHKGIAQGKHCMCRPWPGVQMPSTAVATPTEGQPKEGASTKGDCLRNHISLGGKAKA